MESCKDTEEGKETTELGGLSEEEGGGKAGEGERWRETAVDMEVLKERTDNAIPDPHHVQRGT